MTAILAIAEHRRGELRPVSYELVTAGQELAADLDAEFHVAVISGTVSDFADTLDRDGVDVIHTVDYGEEFDHGVYTQATCQLVDALEPWCVLIPHSANGLDYAPAVATRLGWPLVTDVSSLGATADRLAATRDRHGGARESAVTARTPAVVTIRNAAWAGATGTGSATIEPFELSIDDAALGASVDGFEEVTTRDSAITTADVLVGVGRGIGSPSKLPLCRELAERLGGTLAGTAPAVHAGWLPRERLVGQFGATVSPAVYLAIGISGTTRHATGITDAETIVAINSDPDAPIMALAEYAIHDDIDAVVPALIDALGE